MKPKFQLGEEVGGITIGMARYNWSRFVAEANSDLRLRCIGNRAPIRYERAIIRAGIAEILTLRLEAAYAPIFETLQKIERKVGALADLRREPWASPNHPVNR